MNTKANQWSDDEGGPAESMWSAGRKRFVTKKTLKEQVADTTRYFHFMLAYARDSEHPTLPDDRYAKAINDAYLAVSALVRTKAEADRLREAWSRLMEDIDDHDESLVDFIRFVILSFDYEMYHHLEEKTGKSLLLVMNMDESKQEEFYIDFARASIPVFLARDVPRKMFFSQILGAMDQRIVLPIFQRELMALKDGKFMPISIALAIYQ